MYTLWIPQISWTIIGFHYFRGHAAVMSTNFVDKQWIPLFSWTRYNDFHHFLENLLAVQWMSTFFVEFKKKFPTTTNKPFLRPRQWILAVKKLTVSQLAKARGYYAEVFIASNGSFPAKLPLVRKRDEGIMSEDDSLGLKFWEFSYSLVHINESKELHKTEET